MTAGDVGVLRFGPRSRDSKTMGRSKQGST